MLSKKLMHLQDHNYIKNLNYIEIDQQVSDDTGWTTTNIGNLQYTKRTIPPKARNPAVNKDKTEQYTISR